MTRLSRRAALSQIGAGALGLAAGSAAAQSRLNRPLPPDVAQIFADFEPGALEPGAGLIAGIHPATFRVLRPRALRRQTLVRLIEETPPAELAIRWPEDATSVDYAHLGPIAADEAAPFTLDGATLAQAARHFGFERRSERPVLFALRGCEILAQEPTRLRLRPRRPNLRRTGCVLGVWTPQSGELSAAAGSTTPSAVHAQVQARLKNAGRVAGLLPTGWHALSVGAHRPDSDRPQPGAFLLAEPACVLRDFGRAAPQAYAQDGGAWMLDGAPIAQGVHAASFSEPYGGVCAFSSSGSLTVAGGYSDGAPTGDWRAFRRAARLSDDIAAPEPARFDLMLLTAAEMRRVAVGAATAETRRLRFGAAGASVAALQRALGVAASGRFDVATQIAVLKTQLYEGARADGIVTPQWARDRFSLTL